MLDLWISNEHLLDKNKANYFPIKEQRRGSGAKRLSAGYKSNTIAGEVFGGLAGNRAVQKYDQLKFPGSIQFCNNRDKDRSHHPTQKPVPLLEYLIKTYTNEGEIVLDNTMGSSSTGIACVNTDRRFIGIEKDAKYFKIGEKRIQQAIEEKSQLLF